MKFRQRFVLLLFLQVQLVSAQIDTTYWPTTGEIYCIYTNVNDTSHRTYYHRNGCVSEVGSFFGYRKVGEWKGFYPSEKLMYVHVFDEDGVNYTYTGYYETGELKLTDGYKTSKGTESKEYWKSGVLYRWFESHYDGTRIQHYYYQNGELQQLGVFPPGGNGTREYFYETGELKRTETYKDMIMVGTAKEYYPDQKLKQTEECIDWHHRDVKEYHPNGNIKSTGMKYFTSGPHGVKIGEWKEFYPNGNIYKTYQFHNGMKTGVWITYYTNGAVQETLSYEEGKPVGFFKEYFKNGQLKCIGEYAKNVYRLEKSGIWTTYHKNGKIKRTTIHAYRGQVGEAREYYRNGKLRRIEQWWHDCPHGTWEYFRRNGKLKLTEEYENFGC